MRALKSVWLWLGLVLLAAAAAAWWWTQQGGGKADAPALATATVVRGDIEDAVSALGAVQPLAFVDVGTQVSGQLRRLAVNVGDMVKQGQLLAEIDTAVLTAKVQAGEATLQSLAAQIDEKQAQLALAEQQFKRNTAMFAEDAVSRDTLDTSRASTQVINAQVAALKAQRQQTAANLRVVQADLGYARILAPMPGTVVSMNAREGQTLNASQQAPTLMRLARLDDMTVVTQVSEADVARLTVGTPAYFSTLGRPDRRWQGQVRQILPTPETVNNVVLYNVLFDVDNSDRALMTQMSAQVFFVLAKAEGALLVPVAALMDSKSAKAGKPGKADKGDKGSKSDQTDKDAKADRPAKADKTARSGATLGAQPALATAAMQESWVEAPMNPGPMLLATGAKAADAGADADSKVPARRHRVRVLLANGQVEDREVTVGVVNRLQAQVLSGLSEGEQVVLAGNARSDKGRTKDGTKDGAKDSAKRQPKV